MPHLWPKIGTVQPLVPLLVLNPIEMWSSVILSPNVVNCTVASNGPAVPALPEVGEADRWVFGVGPLICHVKLLFGFTIVNEIGMASWSATRHEGEPPAVTVTCPIPVKPIGVSQTVTTGGEHVAEADGAVGDEEEPEEEPDEPLPPHAATATESSSADKPRQRVFITDSSFVAQPINL